MAIPYNPIHSPNPIGVGEGLRVKVNANIGTSPDRVDPNEEMKKLAAAHEAGADAIMDLSIGGDIRAMRRRLIAATRLPFVSRNLRIASPVLRSWPTETTRASQ